MSKGLKFDGEKVQMDLLFEGMPDALEAVGKVMTFGAKKYAPNNWKLVDNAQTRYRGAQIRHALAQAKGEVVDAESLLPHAAHEACCVLFKLQLLLEEQNAKA